MATWQKIEDRMPNGGTAVQTALEEINAEVETGGPVATASVTVKVDGITGTVNFRRVGDDVTARGNLTVTKAFSGVFLAAAQIPAGFANTLNVQVSALMASFSHRAMGSWIFNKDGGLALTTANSVADDIGQFVASWPTDDDMPS